METKNYTIEQSMTADNDTLIITDPCYLLKDEHWNMFCNLEFTKNPIGLDNFLRQYFNFGEVIAIETCYGDWSNELITDTEEVIGEFTADAGMVCVVTASDLDNYGYDMEHIADLSERGCLAIIPNYTGNIEARFEYKEVDNKLTVLYGKGEDETSPNFHTLSWGAHLPL